MPRSSPVRLARLWLLVGGVSIGWSGFTSPSGPHEPRPQSLDETANLRVVRLQLRECLGMAEGRGEIPRLRLVKGQGGKDFTVIWPAGKRVPHDLDRLDRLARVVQGDGKGIGVMRIRGREPRRLLQI